MSTSAYRLIWLALGNVATRTSLTLTIKQIQEELGIGRSMAFKALRETVEAGAIEKIKGGYALSPKLAWKGSMAERAARVSGDWTKENQRYRRLVRRIADERDGKTRR